MWKLKVKDNLLKSLGTMKNKEAGFIPSYLLDFMDTCFLMPRKMKMEVHLENNLSPKVSRFVSQITYTHLTLTYSCNPGMWKAEEEDHKLEASLAV